jgi:hypothetical protein
MNASDVAVAELAIAPATWPGTARPARRCAGGRYGSGTWA